MKIKIRKSLLESVLVNSSQFLEKKDASQITSHIYIQGFKDRVTIKATDYDIGLISELNEIDVEEDGQITANGKKLIDIIRILKDEELILETKDDNLIIKQRNLKYKLPTFDAKEYPTFPKYDDLPKVEIDSLKLINAFKKVSSSIDSNNPKFELNGALIDIAEHSVNIVGTDTKRLSCLRIDSQNKNELSIIVPKKAIQEIQKLFFDKIEIYYDNTHLIIKSENMTFFTKLISGKYPDYKRIMPKDFKHTLIIPKDKMVESIKQINVISNEIKITFNKNVVMFENLSEENLEAKTEFEINQSVENFSFAVNSRYLLDFLGACETKDFNISMNENDKPFELKSEDFVTIVMPIIL